MIHNKIHLICSGCPQPSIALPCRIMTFNTIHFVLISLGCPRPNIALQYQIAALNTIHFIHSYTTTTTSSPDKLDASISVDAATELSRRNGDGNGLHRGLLPVPSDSDTPGLESDTGQCTVQDAAAVCTGRFNTSISSENQ